ncbi:MAG: hypothetical protein ABIV06_10745 [Thermoanaerobaculia bacterium]
MANRLSLLALGLLAVATSLFSIRSTDLFWHLASGRFMVEHLAFPRHDPFRFGAGDGLAWVDHEWLFQLLAHGIAQLGGLDGLIGLRVACVLTLAALLVVGLRRTGIGTSAAVTLSAVALIGARPRFLIRPELVTFLALATELILLRRLENPRNARRARFGLVALTVLWTNFHGLALLAPVVAGAYLLGVALARRSDPSPRPGDGRWRQVLTTPLWLAGAMLLNPWGVEVFAVSRGITGAMSDLAAINPEWLPAWRAPQPALFAGFAALIWLVTDTAIRFRRIHLPTGIVTGGLAILALTGVRHQALFFLSGAFLAAETLALRRRSGGRHDAEVAAPPRRSWRAALPALFCLLLAAWCLHPPVSGLLAPRQGRFELSGGIAPGRFPIAAAEWLARRPDLGNLYNELAHGGYLLWRLYPPRRVFLDGRMELEPTLLREIEAARSGAESWREFLRRRGAVGALVRYDDRTRPVFDRDPATGALVPVGRQTPNGALFPVALWALVYWDDQVMLFLDRSQEPNQEFLGEEFSAIQPEDLASTLARAAASPDFRARALAEVERRLSEDPGLRRATWLRERLRALAAAPP